MPAVTSGEETSLRCERTVNPVFLVDTSVWIRHFSSSDSLDLREICSPDDRVLCLPVYQEILQGIRDEGTYREIRHILKAAQFVEDPMQLSLYEEGAQLYRLARRQGVTVRSSVDCLIAATAIRHDLLVLHHDRDFPNLARVSALQERAV
jgi:predicted nucleic acid-binding protein